MAEFYEELPQNVQRIAAKGNLTSPREIIVTPNEKILSFGASADDVRILKTAAAKFIEQNFVNAGDLLLPKYSSKWSRISFGCEALDKCSRGGIVTRGITEICGESGAGKTQILLHLSLTVQLSPKNGGLGKGTAFICTEDAFPSKRLYQLAEEFSKRYPDEKINYLSNIYIEHIIESEDLLKCVNQRLLKLMETSTIGLIIIDSVAAVFRMNSNIIERAKQMRKLANCLLLYGDKYNCGVVCVNQVTTVNDANRNVPCLGLAWAHLGRTRIKISKIPKQISVDKHLISLRRFEIMYSPDSPNEFTEFLITSKGICSVDEVLSKQ
ncbi:DNA repair protein XRCC3 [Eupeodes corollae]|uniref:DNA repair protein XRCC3 n=1 Tax=Eupeodes corollae TaxID=290404 RepID=UPI002490C6FE|nr:DNA repair protein XRCC3 [Eupeodes corollae]